jgi:ParB family chromosome partitioning protein
MKRKALGKGLSALLPDPDPPSEGTQTLEVPLDSLEPNPYQPRGPLTAEAVAELAQSLKESGIIQPILVRRRGGLRYQIIAGERRFRAAQSLGLASVPVTVRDVPDDKLLELALVENIQREELTCLEEAQAYQRLHDEFHLTQEEVAQKVGKDRATIANSLRLLRLPKEIRALLAEGRLDAGHGRALLGLPSPDDQLSLGREAARKSFSVREVERRVALLGAPARPKKTRDANTRAAEERLHAALGTRVEIARRGGRGTVRIQFTSEAELQRLFELFIRGARSKGV